MRSYTAGGDLRGSPLGRDKRLSGAANRVLAELGNGRTERDVAAATFLGYLR